MAQRFKFRYVKEIVGTFVILIVVLLLVGIFLAGRAQQWFVPVHRLTLSFPAEGSFGLQNGAEVVILGTNVGTLDRITVREDGGMTGRINIKGDFIRFVRTDSRALVKKKFVVAGDSFIEISKGTGPRLAEGDTLKAEKDTEITEMIQAVIEKIQAATLPTIEQGRKALEEYTSLAADLRNPEGNLQQLIGRLNLIAQGIASGDSVAGALLVDPTLGEKLQGVIAQVSKASELLFKIVEDVAATTATLPRIAGTMASEFDDVPGFVLQTRDTLQETQYLLEAIQRHWLISSYVIKGEPSSRIPAAAVGGKEKKIQ